MRILYLYNTNSTFVQIDEALLRERYDVKSMYIIHPSPLLFGKMWCATQNVDCVVVWFASWHTLPAFLTAYLRNIPRLLITGGYDVANEPEIAYGLRRGGISQWVSNIIFRLATRVAPFSTFAYQEALQNTPATESKTTLIPLGVPDNDALYQAVPKDDIALTVLGINAVSARRKGLWLFVQAAQYLPDVQFVVVGKATDDTLEEIKKIAPENVIFTGFLSDDELLALRQKTKVYIQASYHEGFGLAVAESMLARCIPVVSRRGALPEVTGQIGVFLDALTPEAVAKGVQQAISLGPQYGEASREHILKNFPLSSRRQLLFATIEQLVRR